MSVQGEVDEMLFGPYGVGPEAVARSIRAHVTAWKSDISNVKQRNVALDAIQGVADEMAILFAARNMAFSAGQFMRDCGL
jgi:hypothetical protein